MSGKHLKCRCLLWFTALLTLASQPFKPDNRSWCLYIWCLNRFQKNPRGIFPKYMFTFCLPFKILFKWCLFSIHQVTGKYCRQRGLKCIRKHFGFSELKETKNSISLKWSACDVDLKDAFPSRFTDGDTGLCVCTVLVYGIKQGAAPCRGPARRDQKQES